MPKADVLPPNRPPGVAIDDRRTMLLGILAFGLAIPWLTGLYGPLRPGDARFWIGFVGFIALAAAIWLGNRWLLFKQREHFNWFGNPFRKLAMLVTANVMYTAPLSALGVYAWFRVSGQAVDRSAIEVVVLTNVICVLFVTHAYETVFLIRERESDLTRVERLERLRSQSELAALKAQIDPHFLFNSLNTLGHLIVRDPPRGREFCDLLAEVYRYVLASRDSDMVPLADELAFVRAYHRLLALRFGAAVQLVVGETLGSIDVRGLVPPLALQTLLENAVKHNQTGGDRPLVVQMELNSGTVRVGNALQARSSVRLSSGLGLKNLDERCRLLTGRALNVVRSDTRFEVQVPVVSAEVPA
jgi:Histidine kinase